MTEKIYVVTLHKHEDLDSFYTEMTDKGFRLNMKRPSSRNTHYWMTEEQAIELRKDSRIWDVQLRPEEMGMVIRRTAENYDTYPVAGNFWKGDTQGSATVSVNDRQWGHLHCAGDTAQRRKGTYGLINQGATDEQVIDTVTVFNDGEHVDVIICDDPVSTDNEEWYSPTTNTTRYVQYDWYTELNTLVSTIDDDGQTLPSAPYANYFKNDTNTESHGNHVCGTVAGQYYGWAREANIYSMQVLGNLAGTGTPVPALLIYDYLRAFHRNKSVNTTTGFKNPTITNHSWGYGYDLTSENLLNHAAPIAINEISSITYGGVTYTSGNPNPSGWTMAGLEADFGIGANKMDIPADYAALRADVEDAIAEGIVIIGAAGNDNFHMVPDTDPNWDNFIKFTTLSNIFFNRGSSPVNAENVIKVGSLSNHHNFLRATYSNFGPAVDVFAPGNNILSAYDNTGLNDTKYTQGTGNYFYPIQGTSMASPQVAGVAACLATGKFRFTNADVLGYIQDHCVTDDMNWNVNGGDFADNTCKKDSPDRYLAAINPRPESGQLTEQIGNRNTGMVFPRTRVASTYEFTGGQTYNISVTFTQAGNYTLSGSDRTGSISGDNIPLAFNEGDTINFNVNAVGHPFWIKTVQGIGTSNGVTNGVTSNGTESGTVTWAIPAAGVQGTYYYQCQIHNSMYGTINISPVGTTGQQAFTTPGTYSWTCPVGVTSVSVVCVGAGGTGGAYGASGGSLAYKNNITVTPGQSYSIVVGNTNTQITGHPYSYTAESSSAFGTVASGGEGGYSGTASSTFKTIGSNYDGGGRGGLGSGDSNVDGTGYREGAGGGAGGYSGDGGNAGKADCSGTTAVSDGKRAPTAGSGGGGGGGTPCNATGGNGTAGGGGGVGLFGEGANGAAGTYGPFGGNFGGGGSGGANGTDPYGGQYGGGSAGQPANTTPDMNAQHGAVRIIWPGDVRQFPSTRTADE
tara:strand:- start:2767 stop:5661 length:2895 start_codon:yes stop_codon:yes gene_type:complete